MSFTDSVQCLIWSFPFVTEHANSTLPVSLLLRLKIPKAFRMLFQSLQTSWNLSVPLHEALYKLPLSQHLSQTPYKLESMQLQMQNFIFLHILKKIRWSFNTWNKTTLFSNIKSVTIKIKSQYHRGKAKSIYQTAKNCQYCCPELKDSKIHLFFRKFINSPKGETCSLYTELFTIFEKPNPSQP